MKGNDVMRESVNGKLMHGFGDPFKRREIGKREPRNRGNFVAPCLDIALVGIDLVTKEDGWPVGAQRCTNTGKPDDGAGQPCFFNEFS